MKQITAIVIATVIMSVWVFSSVQARPSKRLDPRTKQCRILDRGDLDWQSEGWGMGGKKFRQVCKSCHSKDNAKNIPFVFMETYTSKGWNNVFAKRKVQCAKDGSWDRLSEDELMLVNDYLFRNGNWTYDPNDADSCG